MDHVGPRRALLQDFGWPDDAKIVGWVGNFWKRKRPIFFLDVAAELARRDSLVRFVLFGRGGDLTIEKVREAAANRGLADRTALPGFRLPEAANIAGLDVLLAPALREPFGRTLVEAIILGTPLVATSGAGHSEIIGEWGGGELVAEDAVPANVASKVCEMMATKRCLPRMRRQEIAAELSSKAHAERVLQIYQRMSRDRTRRIVRADASIS
jgi:glycosyltransferase involved in cell wall biosynthesis